MTAGSAKRILIAPLDWGLGHTTRCVPVIRRLISLKCEVIFAGNDNQQTYIKQLFPDQEFRYLKGYDIRYGRGKVLRHLLPQLPGLFRTISQEHQWLLHLCATERFDGIISDNRYGLWHPDIPSVIMTHQAQILSGMGKLADRALLRLHQKMLSRFSETWIVDKEKEGNLGGVLSQSAAKWPDTRYIGWLSQFEERMQTAESQHVLILLSGPEPQRTILSDLLWQEASKLKKSVVFVEGKAGVERGQCPPHIRHFGRKSGEELQRLMEQASIVVCRSGYSTLMDLLLFRKPALLIPTPGQTEQEYLAKRLSMAGYFRAVRQSELSLESDLNLVPAFSFPLNENRPHEQFVSVLDQWLERL